MSPVEVNFHGGEVKDDGLYKLQETDLDGDVLDFEEQIFDEEKIYMYKMAEKTTEEETVEAMARGLIVPAVSKNCSAYDQRNQKKANKKRKKTGSHVLSAPSSASVAKRSSTPEAIAEKTRPLAKTCII